MRALVTGGAGFIGSHLVDSLVEGGDEVAVIDDLSTGRVENIAGPLAAGVELIEGSITDPAAVDAAFERARPEAVFHLAAQIDVRRSVTEPAFDLSVNVGGTVSLLERARKQGAERFLFASTGGAIYGEGVGRSLPLAEDEACRPDSPYGQSKLAAEGYLSLYRRLHGFDAISLRLGNVYGPRQDPHGEAGVVAIFCGAMLDGGQPRVFGDGEQTRDYVFAADVSAAFLAACERGGDGPYNVGTGEETSVLEIGRGIAAACGVPFEPEHAPARLGEVQRIAIDPGLAARELGWTARQDLDGGLRLTANSMR